MKRVLRISAFKAHLGAVVFPSVDPPGRDDRSPAKQAAASAVPEAIEAWGDAPLANENRLSADLASTFGKSRTPFEDQSVVGRLAGRQMAAGVLTSRDRALGGHGGDAFRTLASPLAAGGECLTTAAAAAERRPGCLRPGVSFKAEWRPSLGGGR